MTPTSATGTTKTTPKTHATVSFAASRIHAGTGAVNSHRSHGDSRADATPTPNWNVTVPSTENRT
ncbi:hypothetical protein [Clavibacter zhangzhiyongii]|uniref:hypothetical protein n=1 Tax=Clavibacter zhangzhiyongii TaxID=2768071 RepID=UPI0039E10C4D